MSPKFCHGLTGSTEYNHRVVFEGADGAYRAHSFCRSLLEAGQDIAQGQDVAQRHEDRKFPAALVERDPFDNRYCPKTTIAVCPQEPHQLCIGKGCVVNVVSAA